MLRGGPQVSAQDNLKQQQQQKQKKRLSFRDPEVEGPLRNHFFAGCRSKTLGKPTKTTTVRKTSSSVEDLTLEDQALQIAQHVGNAFSDLSATDNDQIEITDFDSISTDFERQKETEILDSSPTDFESCQRSCQLLSFKISADDQEFLDDLVPPLLDETMRGPTFESRVTNSSTNCIPTEPPAHTVRSSSSTLHQIQLLRYQLEQQNQQTQMALDQVKLLQDQKDAESEARQKAQEQNNHLMQQNKQLLSHMEKLFQQIEDFEKQIQIIEHEKKDKRLLASAENQVTSLRKPTTWAASRRPSSEQIIEKPTTWTTGRRSSSEQIEKPTTWTTGRRQSSEQVNEKPSVWTAGRRSNSEQTNEKPTVWATSRKASSEQVSEKPTSQNRSQYTAARRSSLTSSKPLGATPKTSTIQNSTSVLATRKAPSLSSRPLGTESQSKDSATKEKETLRIGDTSPIVQSGTSSPFSSAWKLKSPDSNTQLNADKSLGNAVRSRTGSFSSYTKRTPEGDTPKSTLFSSNNLSTPNTTGKKYSSSTSDLYNTPSTIQGKPSLMIEEPSTSVKSAVSNLNISISKLPRYQPYTGWRRASLTSEGAEQLSAISKDTFNNPQKTSLFNR